MATIKSFSDLEQSKKLAEILPLESADQTWARIAIAGANLDVPEELQYRHNGDMSFQYYSGIGTPCWSLAALLCVTSTYCSRLEITLRADKKYNVFAVKDDFVFHSFDNHPDGFDNIVDGCYELILKLHELKML